MKQYDAYKPSGIGWIGEVPEEWNVCRLKNQADVVLGKMIMSTPPKNTNVKYTLEKYLKSKNIGWLELLDSEDDVEEMWFNDKEKELYRLKSGDIVMNEGGDIGKVAIWVNHDYDCYIQNSVNKISPHKTTDSRFLSFLLYAISKTNYFWSIVSQVSIAHLTKEKLMNTPICIPPFAEQKNIVDYLDAKCAKIDKVVAVQRKRIELLKELKQSIITHAVTKGLDKTAKMKDSGIDWIGKVPERWEVMKLKRVLGDYQDGTHGSFSRIPSDYPLLSAKNVFDNGIIIDDNESTISENDYKTIIANGFPQKGDVAICCVGTIGRCCIYSIDVPMAFQRSVTFLRVNSRIQNTYLNYVLKSDIANPQYKMYAKTSAQSGIYMETLVNFDIVVPPTFEQSAIVAFLDEKCTIIDRQIAKVEKQIDLLNEYKQSVITECVTGKRKVC